MKPFAYDLDSREINREKYKARSLRKTNWWERKRSLGKCYYCNNDFDPKKLTMDHVVPISRGGKSIKGNIVTACKDCNNKKKNFLPMEWKEY